MEDYSKSQKELENLIGQDDPPTDVDENIEHRDPAAGSEDTIKSSVFT